MSILENNCLTPVNVYATVYDMKTKYTVRIEVGDGSAGNKDGHRWTVIMGGAIVAAGWDAGNKREARREAKRALEEMGLLTDGVDAYV